MLELAAVNAAMRKVGIAIGEALADESSAELALRAALHGADIQQQVAEHLLEAAARQTDEEQQRKTIQAATVIMTEAQRNVVQAGERVRWPGLGALIGDFREFFEAAAAATARVIDKAGDAAKSFVPFAVVGGALQIAIGVTAGYYLLRWLTRSA